MSIQVVINAKPVSQAEIRQWELLRALAVFRLYEKKLGREAVRLALWKGESQGFESTPTDCLQAVQQLKLGQDASDVSRMFDRELKASAVMAKCLHHVSMRRRRHCMVEMAVDGISAKAFTQWLNDIFLSDTPACRAHVLQACPDHYLLRAIGWRQQEVIEVTGGAPWPTKFHIVYGDDQALSIPQDPDYPEQLVGVARLLDGTPIGGVRHQFCDTDQGLRASLTVAFPALLPTYFIRQHQWHLACEFSNWARMCLNRCVQ